MPEVLEVNDKRHTAMVASRSQSQPAPLMTVIEKLAL